MTTRPSRARSRTVPKPAPEPEVPAEPEPPEPTGSDPGPVPDEAPVTYSTIVVRYVPDFGDVPLPTLASRALSYDRQRALLTEGGVNLLMQAAIAAAESPDQVAGVMFGVNWFVSVPDEGWIQYTAPSPMIDVLLGGVAGLGSYHLSKRYDYGEQPPSFYVP